MRKARVKVEGSAYYHVMSRCALQEFLLTEDVKEMFLKILRRAEYFSGVKIVNYCIMDNHFHLLVHVPEKREVSDEDLDRRIRVLYGEKRVGQILGRWNVLREIGSLDVVERERMAYRKRMYDLSEFMKTFKQRFSLWYCTNHGNMEGTIWQGPFHSVLIEGKHDALGAVSAYITLNPVRAKLVEDPGDYAWSAYGAACAGDGRARSALLSAYGERQSIAVKWRAYQAMLEVKISEDGGNAACTVEAATSAGSATEKMVGEISAAQKMRSRDKGVSRGLALGSRKFVLAAIVKFCPAGKTFTIPRAIGVGERKTPLFCAGRRSA